MKKFPSVRILLQLFSCIAWPFSCLLYNTCYHQREIYKLCICCMFYWYAFWLCAI